MSNGRMTYGAAAAKTRGMYGKRLTETSWTRLAAAGSLRELWRLLSQEPAWPAVAARPDGAEDAAVLCRSLTEQLAHDCHSLALYLPQEDRPCLSFFLRRREHGAGMSPEDYQAWWSAAGKADPALRRIVGAEADALNLVYILRLRRFPASHDKAGQYLIPVHDKLKPALVTQLLQAPNDEAVRRVLDGTPWAGVFASLAPGDLERQYRAYMETFCRRIMVSAPPGLAEVQAFLSLKEMQRQKLTRLIGAVEQGIDPHAVL